MTVSHTAEHYPVTVVRSAQPEFSGDRKDSLIRMVQTGYGTAENGESFLLLRPGTVLMIHPEDRPVMEMLTEAVFLDFYFDSATAVLMQTSAPALTGRKLRILSPAALEQAVRLWNDIATEQRLQKPGCQLAVLEKFLSLERLLCQDGRDMSGLENKLAETLHFMAENYSRDITLNDLAGLVGMSISHYRRSFRRLMGIAPIDCLLDLRLYQAEKRLMETDLSIAAVAAETGFSDPNYFSRLFARRKGMPPRQWRGAIRKN